MANAKSSTCASCPVFDLPALDEKTRAARLAAGGEIRGECRLMPVPVMKRPADWCGQHPERRDAQEG